MDKYTVIVQLAELVAQARREGFESHLYVGDPKGVYDGAESSSFLIVAMRSGHHLDRKQSSLSKGLALYAEALADLEKLRAEKVERLAKEKAERREQYLKLKAEFYGEGV